MCTKLGSQENEGVIMCNDLEIFHNYISALYLHCFHIYIAHCYLFRNKKQMVWTLLTQ